MGKRSSVEKLARGCGFELRPAKKVERERRVVGCRWYLVDKRGVVLHAFEKLAHVRWYLE